MSRLANLLIVKSLAEVLFVGALAVNFYLSNFNPFFRGALDEANERRVTGWAVNESAPQARVEVQLYLNDRFAGSRTADVSRPDVLEAGRAADEQHGFSFETPILAEGEYEARVYAVHAGSDGTLRTLHLIGFPKRFKVESGGANDSSPAPRQQEGEAAR